MITNVYLYIYIVYIHLSDGWETPTGSPLFTGNICWGDGCPKFAPFIAPS